MLQKTSKSGFTLIELLVVVLIIGILTSVALPQYQKAIMKSKVAALQVALSGVKTAEEAYFAENDRYAVDLNELDIGHSCSIVAHGWLPGDTSIINCGNGFLVDVISGSYNHPPIYPAFYAYYCPTVANTTDATIEHCVSKRDFIYTIWFDHSDHPGERTCEGKTDFGKEVCKTIK